LVFSKALMRACFIPSLLVFSGCGGQAASPDDRPPEDSVEGATAWFEECGEASGVGFLHVSRLELAEEKRFPEIMGGGVALCDLEGDGDLDLYLVQSGDLAPAGEEPPGNRLYKNDGSGHFEDVTGGSGADDRGYGMGVGFGDVDGDGRGDLFVTNVGANRLLLNQGELGFESRAVEDDPACWSTSTAMVDFDHDGDLDVFVCNYVQWSLEGELGCTTASGVVDYCSPNSYDAPLADSLLRNDGEGRMRDVSREAGMYTRRGNGLGVVCGDYDSDGLVDIFVANDQMENHLWHNEGEGRFEDIAARTGCAVDQHGRPKAGMGTVAEDVDDDGDLDLLVVNLRAQADSFFRNEGTFFVDETPFAGLASESRSFTRFGVGWVDFDNDGCLDLFEANGRVSMYGEPEPGQEDPYAEPNLLMRGSVGGRFLSVAGGGGPAVAIPRTSRGAAFGDVDGDGGIELCVVNKDARVCLLRNVHPERGHWVRFAVRDGGRDALGARLLAPVGGRTLRRDVRSAFSYCSANDPRVHIGLGSLEELEQVEVHWPNGEVEVFGPFEADRDHELLRGAGRRERGR